MNPIKLRNGKELNITIGKEFYNKLPKEIFTEEILNDFMQDVLLKECEARIYGNIRVFRFKNDRSVFVETFIER